MPAIPVLLGVAGLRAQELPDPDSPERHSPATTSYAWQTLTTDGVAASFFVAALAANENTDLYGLSGITYLFGAPVVHISHGNLGTAAASFGLRATMAFAGAGVGTLFDSECSTEDDAEQESGCGTPVGLLSGIVVGAATVIALDALVFAHDEAEPERLRRRGLFRWQPTVSLLPSRSRVAGAKLSPDLQLGLFAEF